MESLHHAGTACPARTGATGERQHSRCSTAKSFFADLNQIAAQSLAAVDVRVTRGVFNSTRLWQRVLRKADAATLQFRTNVLMLDAIESVLVQQAIESLATIFTGFAFSWKQMLDESRRHPREFRPGLRRCAKCTEFGALAG